MKNSLAGMVLAAAMAFSFAATAAEQRLPSSDGGYTDFMLPSGNIGCIYIPEGGTDVYQPEDGGPELQCDRMEPTYVRTILNATGKGKIYRNVGDASCCNGPVLKYGNSTTLGPFYCESERTGLTCYRGKNGFSLSRRKISAW
jgi:hypothetical protein